MNILPERHRAQKSHRGNPTAHLRLFKGLYQNLRIISTSILLLIFFTVTWITIHGNPAIFFDLTNRRFHLFGTVYFPQDFSLLSLFLIICALGLFTVTVVMGRIWCGYACPQSVFTWLFVWIEQLIEGNLYRKKSSENFTASSLLRKCLKHILWIFISGYTAITFVSFFIPIKELIPQLYGTNVELTTYFWVAFFTIATYLNAGWLREKVCLHMCPYARFQSVMFDQHTQVVTYDQERGEPRGSAKKNAKGDCIDCSLCVRACPTGIDIRNGLQYECISCGACIDACNSVMKKLNRPPQLIQYTSEIPPSNRFKSWLRPKFIGYFSALICITVLFFYTAYNRELFTVTIAKDNTTLFTTLENRAIANLYILTVTNKSNHKITATIKIENNNLFSLTSNPIITVNKYNRAQSILKVTCHANHNRESMQIIRFIIDPHQGSPITIESRFFSPKESLQHVSL